MRFRDKRALATEIAKVSANIRRTERHLEEQYETLRELLKERDDADDQSACEPRA